jgi:hypothetical protein
MWDPLAAAVLLLQAGIGWALLVALGRADAAAATNAAVALAIAVVVPGLGAALSVRGTGLASALSLWVAAAGFLHCLGMLGLYDTRWWWDHLTHLVSAALVAALLYAALLVSAAHSTRLALPPGLVGVAAVLSTLAVGVFWELVELFARDVGESLGVDPVLVHYGWRDTAADLAFDTLGAVVVVALDVRLFVAVVEQFPGLTGTLLLWSGGAVVAGSFLLAASVWVVR